MQLKRRLATAYEHLILLEGEIEVYLDLVERGERGGKYAEEELAARRLRLKAAVAASRADRPPSS